MVRYVCVLAFALLVVSAHASAQSNQTMGLRQMVASALTRSPQLRSPDDAVELARIRATQADSQYGIKTTPSISAGSDSLGNPQQTLGLGLSKRLPTGGDASFSATSFRYGADAALRDSGYSLNLTQPLFQGFGVTTSIERTLNSRGVTVASQAAADARTQLVVSTAEAYFAVLRQRRQHENAQRAIDRAKQLRTGSAARARVGMATELDVLRADLLAARAESSLGIVEELQDAAVDALKTIAGLPLDQPIDIVDEDLSDAALQAAGFGAPLSSLAGASDADLEQLVQTALGGRRDLQEARNRIEDARRSETLARFSMLPQTAMNVTYTRRGLGASTDLFGPLLNGWRVGFTSGYTLDRATARAAMASASLGVRQAANQVEDLEQRVRAEVRRAYRAWDRSRGTVDVQAKAVAIAEKQVRLAEIRYERGVAGNFDIVDAEGLLFQARADLEGARIDRALAGLNLSRATGQLDAGRFLP